MLTAKYWFVDFCFQRKGSFINNSSKNCVALSMPMYTRYQASHDFWVWQNCRPPRAPITMLYAATRTIRD